MPQSRTGPTRRMRAKGPRRFLRPLARARLLWQQSAAVPPSRLPVTFRGLLSISSVTCLTHCSGNAGGTIRLACGGRRQTEPDAGLRGLDWQNMLKLPPGWTPTNFVPTFFHDEPDPNQKGNPRLDIVVSFDNGVSARYHPSAVPIWSTETQPTDAMQTRYTRAKHLRR